MFDPNFIGIYDDAISSTECDTIIKWSETNDWWRGSFGDDEIDFTMKKAWQISTNVIEPPYYVQDIIRKGLNNSIVIYKETYSDVNRGAGCTWNVQSYYNIQKYDPGDGYYGLHCENDGIGSRNRVLAWMFYLNTVTDKGGTYFSSYDKTIKAKKGRLVIWPAYWTHSHKGIPSPTQTKYIATGWYAYEVPCCNNSPT